MTKPAYVAVFDGARACIYSRDGEQLSPVAEFSSAKSHLRTHDALTDRAGRTSERATGLRHGLDLPSDPQREAKRDFVGELAEWLDDAVGGGKCGRVVIVAPPAALGDFRAGASKRLLAAVAAEFHKDLTKEPILSLQRHVTALMEQAGEG